jgi:hypothetical protein
MAQNGSTALGPEVLDSEPRIGGSGVVRFGGYLYNMADYNPTLTGQSAMGIYEEMEADAEIAAGLARIVWPLLAAKWTIEPVDDSDEEVEIAQYCEKWIMGYGRTDPFAPRWQDTLRHALLCLTFGFSAFEKNWGRDRDGHQVINNLYGILPKSVWDFVFDKDTGELSYMDQRAYLNDGTYAVAQIPAAKLLLFSFGQQADNLWGRPIIRPCYKNWYHKDKLLRVDGMRHERHGMGFATITVNTGAGNSVKLEAEKLIRDARANERGYAVLEEGQVVSFNYPGGQGTDVIGSVKYHDVQTSQVLFSEVMHVVSGGLGAKGANESKLDFVLAVLQGLGNLVEQGFQPLIPELVGKRWGNRDAWPTVKCEDLSKLSGSAMAETLSKLLPAGSGAITPNVDLEQSLRETYQFPPLPEEIATALKDAEKLKATRSLEALRAPQPVAPTPPIPGATPPAEPPAQPPAKTAAEPAAGRLGRGALPHEAYFAAAETSAWLDSEPQKIWYRVVAPYRKVQIERIAKLSATTSDEEFKGGKLNAAITPKVLMQKALTKSLAEALRRVYGRGRQAILHERDRQLAGQPPAATTMQEGDAEIEPTQEELQWVEATAATFVSLMLGSMITEALKALGTARNADATAKNQEIAVRDALNALSVPVQVANLGGAVNQSYTNGRNEQAASMRGETETAFYSAIMDEGTCGPCEALDGEEHDPGDEAFATPNPECEGDWRCRCITIYVFREEAA